MSKHYFLYRRVEFWLLCALWALARIAFPLRSVKNWVSDSRCNYVYNRNLEAKAAIRKCEAESGTN